LAIGRIVRPASGVMVSRRPSANASAAAALLGSTRHICPITRWCRSRTSRWVNAANLTLLGELRRPAEAIEWAGLTATGIVQMLDAFEAAQASQTARHT